MALTVAPAARRLLLALGGLALLAGVWGGLLRIGWFLPTHDPALPGLHGPLMASGFLGVVIGLERAVALGRAWGYAAPALAGLGGLLLIGGAPGAIGAGLMLAGSLVLLAVFARFYRLRPDWAGGLLALASGLWAAGNALWLAGWPLHRVVPWWAGFLVVTIAAERLELAQLVLRPLAARLLIAACGLVVVGLLLTPVAFEPGLRLVGLGLIGLAAWGARFDVARRTIRHPGLPRFIALCLLLGYAWLALAGLLWLARPELFVAGPWYDAMLHALFVGFVFSMIFGHAPTIVPAVTGLMVPFRRRFYLHVALLHGSLLLRTVGDLAPLLEARRWGGLLNAAAMLLFVLLTAAAAVQARRSPATRRTR